MIHDICRGWYIFFATYNDWKTYMLIDEKYKYYRVDKYYFWCGLSNDWVLDFHNINNNFWNRMDIV